MEGGRKGNKDGKREKERNNEGFRTRKYSKKD